VRIRVRMGPSHPLASRKRRLNGGLRMRPEKKRGPVSQQVLHDRDHSMPSIVVNFQPFTVMVTSPYK
jgi:hypothetical protein